MNISRVPRVTLLRCYFPAAHEWLLAKSLLMTSVSNQSLTKGQFSIEPWRQKGRLLGFVPHYFNCCIHMFCTFLCVLTTKLCFTRRAIGAWCAARSGTRRTKLAICSPVASTARPSAGTSTSLPCCKRSDTLHTYTSSTRLNTLVSATPAVDFKRHIHVASVFHPSRRLRSLSRHVCGKLNVMDTLHL